MVYIFTFQDYFRKAADRLSDCFIKRNHVSIWNWIQKYDPQKISSNKKKISLSNVIKHENVIKAGQNIFGYRVATKELESKEILGISVSKEQNMFFAERFISDVCTTKCRTSGFHRWWYTLSPEACRFLN